MRPAFFTKITLADADVATLLSEYLQWCVGEGRFRALRHNRLAMGVPRSLTVDALAAGGDFAGANDCSLSCRRADSVALLRLVHRDADDGAILWHSYVRLTEDQRGATIEHAIVRTAPRDESLEPRASSPRIIEELIKAYGGGGIEPRDLYTASTRLADTSSTEAFVEHVLLDRSRAVPVLIVTPSVTTGALGVDPAPLAKLVRGMAMVATLAHRDCTVVLTNLLQDRGFSRQFTCFDGGVRLYAPGLSPADELHRHPLWIRTWLADLDADTQARTELIAGLVAGRVAAAAMPTDLVSAVQEFDRIERRRVAERLLAAEAAAPPAAAGPTADDVADRDRKIADLEKALRDANETIELYADDNRQFELTMRELEQRKEKLEYEAQAASLRAEGLQQNLQDLKQGLDGELPDDVRSAIAALMSDELTPEHALRLAAITWPDRLLVLDSAYKSARKSKTFHRPDDVMSLLSRLSTSYFDVLATGGGDHDARKVFGKDEFAAMESDTVMNNKAAVKRRTFIYKGASVEMFKHLKIGIKDSVAETFRIHFHWDSKEQRVVVGHCGPHLDFD